MHHCLSDTVKSLISSVPMLYMAPHYCIFESYNNLTYLLYLLERRIYAGRCRHTSESGKMSIILTDKPSDLSIQVYLNRDPEHTYFVRVLLFYFLYFERYTDRCELELGTKSEWYLWKGWYKSTSRNSIRKTDPAWPVNQSPSLPPTHPPRDLRMETPNGTNNRCVRSFEPCKQGVYGPGFDLPREDVNCPYRNAGNVTFSVSLYFSTPMLPLETYAIGLHNKPADHEYKLNVYSIHVCRVGRVYNPYCHYGRSDTTLYTHVMSVTESGCFAWLLSYCLLYFRRGAGYRTRCWRTKPMCYLWKGVGETAYQGPYSDNIPVPSYDDLAGPRLLIIPPRDHWTESSCTTITRCVPTKATHNLKISDCNGISSTRTEPGINIANPSVLHSGHTYGSCNPSKYYVYIYSLTNVILNYSYNLTGQVCYNHGCVLQADDSIICISQVQIPEKVTY